MLVNRIRLDIECSNTYRSECNGWAEILLPDNREVEKGDECDYYWRRIPMHDGQNMSIIAHYLCIGRKSTYQIAFQSVLNARDISNLMATKREDAVPQS